MMKTGDVMQKVINGTKISFYDENNEIMYIDYPTDECVWYFRNSNVITITEDMELFNLLKSIMSQQYIFNDNCILKSYKNSDKLVWYSDCYYDLDNEYSRKNVSYLTIQYIDNVFKVGCRKPLDDIIDRKIKSHLICFSPSGNGQFAMNIETGLTLQDDFVLNVYQKLIIKEKVKELHKN